MSEALLERLYLRLKGVATLSALEQQVLWREATQCVDAFNLLPSSTGALLESLALLRRRLREGEETRSMVRALSAAELSSHDHFNVAQIARELTRDQRIPDSLKDLKDSLIAKAITGYRAAESSGDFRIVEPLYSALFKVWRQESSYFPEYSHPYNYFLDLFSPGLQWEFLREAMHTLDPKRWMAKPKPRTSSRRGPLGELPLGVEVQKLVIARIAEHFGLAGHLVCAQGSPALYNCGPGDQRLALRFDPWDFRVALFDALHEMGHALYNFRLPKQYWGAPLGSEASVAAQETLAKFFENCLGRDPSFLSFIFSLVRDFAAPLGVTWELEDLVCSANRRNFLHTRIDADEVTYLFHLRHRLELEAEIASAQILDAESARTRWNELHAVFLGTSPPSDKTGILQEASWAYGTLGYFGAYFIGNIAAFRLFLQLQESFPRELTPWLCAGECMPILEWLDERVISRGAKSAVAEFKESGELTETFSRYLDSLRSRYGGS
jgi:carboxypeptidase Taq